MQPSVRWKELLDERLHEAVSVLGRLPGVRGFLVGGSVGRGEPWPMSDIDLLPIYTETDLTEQICRHRDEIIGWWSGSGRAQSLDIGRLHFTVAEIHEAMAADPAQITARSATAGFATARFADARIATARFATARFADRRWFHGLDKAYGGHAADPADELVTAFADWINGVRFHPAVVVARIATWRREAAGALAEATRLRAADPAAATHQMRESARAVRMVLLESWGERLGSMGREWTRFERMAAQHGHAPLAGRVATIAGADARTAAERALLAPAWLRERIDLCLGARAAVGEQVTPAENARDQLAAFTVHVTRHRPDLDGPWTGSPDPHLDTHLADLTDLLTNL